MKNVIILLITCGLLFTAGVAGWNRSPENAPSKKNKTEEINTADDLHRKIPSIGKIQVLNGCGIDGAANQIAEYLRTKRFDVKNISNAPTGNYNSTLVVSRKKDDAIARQVAQALHLGGVVLIRNGDDMFDVTVYVGADYQERMR